MSHDADAFGINQARQSTARRGQLAGILDEAPYILRTRPAPAQKFTIVSPRGSEERITNPWEAIGPSQFISFRGDAPRPGE